MLNFIAIFSRPLARRLVAGRVLSRPHLRLVIVTHDPEIDIWRAAMLMLKRYGDEALKESAARATELTLAGDDDGAATWHRIMEAVTQLANTTPPGPVH